MKKKKLIVPAVIGAVIIGAGAGGFIAGKAHYETHFYPGTFINGIGVSNQTLEVAEQRVADQEIAYTLTVKLRGDASFTLDADALGMEFVNDGSIQKLLEDQQSDDIWVRHISGQKKLTVPEKFSVSEEKARASILKEDAFQTENMTPPVDAKLEYDGNTYSVTPAEAGTTLKVDEAIAAILKAADEEEESIDLDALNLYEAIEQPVDAAALQAQADAANQMLTANITYQMAGKTFTINHDLLKDWVSMAEDGTVSLDETKVRKWVDQMAHDTDTFGLSRKFTTHSGREIQLVGGGDYGWAMNEDATTAELVQMIRDGAQNDNAQAKYQYGAQDRGANDIGGSYVEINLSQQKMWAYKNGQQVVETDIVSGNESAGLSTPSGSVWAIDGKIAPRHFKTTNVDVDFWLPFNGGVGLHNATWRSSYGGTIFKTNGSHGCINTPYDAMKIVFENMEIGYPVVVYYSEDQVVGPAPTGQVTGG